MRKPFPGQLVRVRKLIDLYEEEGYPKPDRQKIEELKGDILTKKSEIENLKAEIDETQAKIDMLSDEDYEKNRLHRLLAKLERKVLYG